MSAATTPSPYRFVRLLAEGGMGLIELVVRREGAFARPYARKRLLARFANDPEVRAMFLEEARVAGLVRHANVVGVLDVGEDDDGPFFVMDLVDGVPLHDVVSRFGGKLPVQVALEISRQIAEGLHAAHELVAPDGRAMGLVHRDVSLANVIVGFDGTVRVTDFGVARALDRESLTRIGTLKGRLSYMSAEQLEHKPLDRRADVYSLGVVLAEMLRGSRLHGAASPEEVARRTLHEPPEDPGEWRDDLPPELVALLFELMARDRDARPRDAQLVARRLLSIATEVRANEGPIDLGELVRGSFGDVRAANAEIVRIALEGRDGHAAPLVASPGDAPLRLEDQPTRLVGPVPRSPRARASKARSPLAARVLVAAAGVIVVGIALTLWLVTASRPVRLEAPPGVPTIAALPPAAPPTAAPAAVVVSESPGPERSPVPPSRADVAADSAPGSVAPERGSTSPAPARPRRRSSQRNASGVQTWSWE